MGERDWWQRYRTARDYADEQAEAYRTGGQVDTYRGITGAAWVAEAYDIAAENASSLAQTQGAHYRSLLDECKRLAQEYREKASNRHD